MGNNKSRPASAAPAGRAPAPAAPGDSSAGSAAHGSSSATVAATSPTHGDGGAATATASASTVSAGTTAVAHADPMPMPVRKAVLEDFIMLKTVGKGSFGKVVMVKKKDDDRVYAMKILKKEMVIKRKQYEHTLAERKILENIDHPYIVSLRFAFQTEHKLYMVFDFFNGGELYHYLSEGGRFSEDRARFYAAEITSALDYLHKRGIVYRDLKPENLILDSNGHIRVTDFGLSKDGVTGDTITSICGTPEYYAPEILRKRPYGAAVDWWSLGTLLFEMIAGLPPFYDKNKLAMYRRILEAPLSVPAHMSPEAVDICTKLLVREPMCRLGYNGVHEIKSHPFFASIDWEKLERTEVTPPWTPLVSGAADVRNISSEFINEPADASPSSCSSSVASIVARTTFRDFSFNGAESPLTNCDHESTPVACGGAASAPEHTSDVTDGVENEHPPPLLTSELLERQSS